MQDSMTECQRSPSSSEKRLRCLPTSTSEHKGKKEQQCKFLGKNNKKLFLGLPEKSVHCGNVRGLEGKAATIFPDDTVIE